MPSRRRCQTKDPAQKTIPTKSTHSPAPPRATKEPRREPRGSRRGDDSNKQPYWARRASKTASRSRATAWSATTSSVERAPT